MRISLCVIWFKCVFHVCTDSLKISLGLKKKSIILKMYLYCLAKVNEKKNDKKLKTKHKNENSKIYCVCFFSKALSQNNIKKIWK